MATPVMNGQKLRLECKAEGVPRPQYLWFQGQKALSNQKSPILEIDKVRVYEWDLGYVHVNYWLA